MAGRFYVNLRSRAPFPFREGLLISRPILEPSRYEPYPPSSQSSGTISATSSPSSNILTVELSETATDTASVRLDTEAAATWRLPSPRGTSKWFETASMYRVAERTTPSSDTTNAPSSWASSLSVSRRFGSTMRLLSWGWPYNGSRIMGLECSRTASESPTTKRVPILRPSLPSRAISTARFTTLLSVLLFTPRLSEQTSSSKCASGPILSVMPPPWPSDALELLVASSTAASSPSRSKVPVYLTPFTKRVGVPPPPARSPPRRSSSMRQAWLSFVRSSSNRRRSSSSSAA